MNQLEEKTVVMEDEEVDYESIVASDEFRQLLADKKKFTIPYTLFYIGYSVLLPALAFFTDILNTPAFGDLTWAWLYAVSFIPVSLFICNLYVKKAASFDEQAKEILEKEGL